MHVAESNSVQTSLLDLAPKQSRAPAWAAGGVTALLHGGLIAFALLAGSQVTQRVTELRVTEMVEIALPVTDEAPEEVAPEEPISEPEPVEPPREAQPAVAPTPENPEPEDSSETEESPPPAPAEAGQVLTAEDEVVDFGDTIISGKGDHFAWGLSSADGTSKTAVRNPNARPGGVVGGTGSGKPVRADKPVDLSRPPRLAGGMHWDCPFPREADFERIDNAAVSLVVSVDTTGKVQSVSVVGDPGFGFGREARRCALQKRWDPGLDKNGSPTTTEARIKVRFQR